MQFIVFCTDEQKSLFSSSGFTAGTAVRDVPLNIRKRKLLRRCNSKREKRMLHLLKRLPRRIAVLRMATFPLSLSLCSRFHPYPFIFLSRVFLLLLLFFPTLQPSLVRNLPRYLLLSSISSLLCRSRLPSCSRHSNNAVVYIQFVSRNYNLSRIGAEGSGGEDGKIGSLSLPLHLRYSAPGRTPPTPRTFDNR